MRERREVNCNGCRRCCVNDLIVLHPECGDDPSQYETVSCTNPVTGKESVAVAKKPGSTECIYLGEKGCTIHDRAPAICREFDCGAFYLAWKIKYTRNDRRMLLKAGLIGADLIARGKEVLLAREEKP